MSLGGHRTTLVRFYHVHDKTCVRGIVGLRAKVSNKRTCRNIRLCQYSQGITALGLVMVLALWQYLRRKNLRAQGQADPSVGQVIAEEDKTISC